MQGDIRTFADLLGADADDPRVQAAMSTFGNEFTTTTYRDRGYEERYVSDDPGGITLCFDDGVLCTVFFRVTATANEGVYSKFDTLVAGVTAQSSRLEIETAFGTPERSMPTGVFYALEPGFVKFEFDNDALSLVVVVDEILGPPPSQAEGVSAEAAETTAGGTVTELRGGIEPFARAIGARFRSPEHQEILVLAGPHFDVVQDEEDETTKYENYSNNGVIAQFNGNKLAVILIRLVSTDEGDAAFPEARELFTGLTLPTSRDTIRAYFGQPVHTTNDMDLFARPGLYVRFDYGAEQSTELLLIHPSASA